jgi:hypothetical protein
LLDEANHIEELVNDGRVKILVTGHISPWKKRRIGAESSTGDYIALLDSDAYPSKNWLNNALKNFKNRHVFAVMGPAITPDEDTILQKASGCVYLSPLVGGLYRYRYVPTKKRVINDCHTCNFIVQKYLFLDVSKDSEVNYWPGEDTKLYLDLKAKAGPEEEILYDPDALVYHHRRSLFVPHLKQIYGYVTTPFILSGRSFTSKIIHTLPMWLIIGGIVGITLTLLRTINPFIMPTICIIYFFSVLLSTFLACRKSSLKIILLVFLGTVLTHIVYGVGLIKYIIFGDYRKK